MTLSAFRAQLADLERRLDSDPHAVGVEALKIFEDLLFDMARARGWRGRRGGINEYLDYLGKRRALSAETIALGRRYADIRNCLAHRSGLLVSRPLAEEILAFVQTVCKAQGQVAGDVMTRHLRTVTPDTSLDAARHIMLVNSIGHLPVVVKGRFVGLLTHRDLLAAWGLRDTAARVADVMTADVEEQVAFVAEDTPLDDVLDLLSKRKVEAVLVTAHGDREEPLLGIITASDVLPLL